MKRIAILAFSEQGYELAEQLAEALSAGACEKQGPATAGAEQAGDLQCEAFRSGQPEGAMEWTAKHFLEEDALIYVGACGIAVRAIAPHVKDKTKDPAVCVMDERGMHVISVLSGHLGGANDLTRRIAKLTGADPVITTATDRNGVFAVDEWAKRQHARIQNPGKIKGVSSVLLAGGTVRIKSDWPIEGELPGGVTLTQEPDYDVLFTTRTGGKDVLRVIPRILVLGVGCKSGTPQEKLEEAFRAVMAKGSVYEEAFCLVTSIDRKAQEEGLLSFCKAHALPLQVYSAEELRQVRGNFSSSAFVQKITGVDNVCERSAVLGSGGKLFLKKDAGNGVTMAAAVMPYAPNWRWQYA